MHELIRHRAGRLDAVVAHSTRADGDLSPADVEPTVLAERRAAALALPWQAVRQVHSDRVIEVEGPAPDDHRPIGDALVTSRPDVALAVHSGDCVPIGLVHAAGAVGVAHGGWRGLEAGILEATVRLLRQRFGTGDLQAVVGPHIRAARYEFGPSDLARLAGRFGPEVVGVSKSGRPALDLTAAVTLELDRLGVPVVAVSDDCTAGRQDRYWSHRARGESGRIALVAHLEVTAR